MEKFQYAPLSPHLILNFLEVSVADPLCFFDTSVSVSASFSFYGFVCHSIGSAAVVKICTSTIRAVLHSGIIFPIAACAIFFFIARLIAQLVMSVTDWLYISVSIPILSYQ